MQTYLRVKHKDSGHELSLSQTQYDFEPEAYELLDDKPAVDTGGNPLSAKYKTTVSAEAAKKAASTKEKS